MKFVSARCMRGVSLIELMIALALGAFLMLGLVRIFSASRTAYQLSEGVSRVQENGRFAIDFIQRDLRMVGHMGCVNDQAHLQNAGALRNHVPVGATPGSGVNFPLGIQAYEATKTATSPALQMNLSAAVATWVPALPASVTALNPLPGSDVLQLRFLASEGAPVESIAVAGTTSTIRIPPGRWAALTRDGAANPVMFGLADCSFADLFVAQSTNPATGTITVNTALDRYTPQPQGQTVLYRVESVVYFVGRGANGGRSLMRARSGPNGVYAAAEELVEGIESVQLQLGLDRNVATMPAQPPSGYIGNYLRPSAVTNTEPNWRAVGAVKLGVLASSPQRSAAEQPVEPRSLLGVRFTPADAADSRYRFAYETTVALRNRLYGN